MITRKNVCYDDDKVNQYIRKDYREEQSITNPLYTLLVTCNNLTNNALLQENSSIQFNVTRVFILVFLSCYIILDQ